MSAVGPVASRVVSRVPMLAGCRRGQLRSQRILCSQSRERLLFNCCSLLLFSFSCPTMLDTGAVGPTLYVLFLYGYVYI